MSNLEIIEKAIASTAEEVKEIRKAEVELIRRKNRIANVVAVAARSLVPVNPDDEDSEEQIDDVLEAISDFAADVGLAWNGGWDYGHDWEPGEEVEFWVPSTC